ncbi:MAG: GNAT family N-acetyltransferase, partial [Leucothrix sp.]
LLLAPEPITEKPLNLTQRTSDTLVYKKIDRSCLLKDEQQLKQLFGLLVIAHYQTRPSDLLHILDAQALSIHTVFRGDQIIAAAIVSHEGGFDPALAMAVYRGERRPKGHLVPQILLSQVGLLEAASLTTDRIMRIATHPSYRRQQVASYLLQAIAAQSASDYLSTSFGLSGTLFSFWQQAMFTPVYLGMKREASSGYHSAVFLHALTQSGEALLHASSQSFARNLIAQLADSLKDYDAEITSNLLAAVAQPPTTLCPQEIRDIQRFSRAQCGLDSATAALQRWLPKALAENKQKLQNKEAKLLIMRILQHHNWSHCCKMLGLPSKQIAQHTLQAATATLAEGLAVGTDASMEGLTSIKD